MSSIRTAPNGPLLTAARASLEAWHSQQPHAAESWRTANCPLLEYARSQRGDLTELLKSEDPTKTTTPAASVLLGFTHEHHRIALGSIFPNQQNNPPFQDQLAHQMTGLLSAILAAHDWHQERSLLAKPNFTKHLLASLTAYQAAWPLWPEQPSTGPGSSVGSLPSGANFAPVSLGTQMLQAGLTTILATNPGQQSPFSQSTLLTVRRLLDYLLIAEPEPPANNRSTDPTTPFLVETNILYAVRNTKSSSDFIGQVGGLQVCSANESYAGCYLDPVAFGLAYIDPTMIDSLTLAWRRVVGTAGPLTQAIRIAPTVPFPFTFIEGTSAGGIFACAILAAASRTELNTRSSTSVQLVPPDEPIEYRSQGLSDLQIKPVEPSSITAKLLAFRQKIDRTDFIASCRVVLHPKQLDPQGRPFFPPAGAPGADPVARVTLTKGVTLQQVYEQLTGNSRMEKVLERYSDRVLTNWNQAWESADDPHNLLYYVPPQYRLFKPSKAKKGAELFLASSSAALRKKDENDPREPHEDISFESEDQTLAELLRKGGNRLCISEGPGAGKSIFTRRVQAFLSGEAGRTAISGGKAILAVRWEEWGLETRWPDNFEQALANEISNACQSAGISETPSEVVAWALAQGRVVFVLDSLDQTSADRIQCFIDFMGRLRQQGWLCRIILTGRPFAIESLRAPLFDLDGWRYGAVLPFDLEQQYRYLRGPEAVSDNSDAWRTRNLPVASIRPLLPAATDNTAEGLTSSLQTLFPDYAAVAELLGNPNVLWMVRSLVEAGEELTFRNRTELYLQTSRFMLDYGAKKLRHWPTDNETFRKVGEHEVTLQQIQRWEAILAAMASQMMSQNPKHFHLTGKAPVGEARAQANQRLASPATEAEWQLVDQITALANRTLLYDSGQLVWAWPNRRMLEFYCGLHLAQNSQPGWVQNADDLSQPLRCGDPVLRKQAGNPQWKEAWCFAMLMPPTVRDDHILCASLAELLQPQAGANTENRRPTELMYYALGLLQPQILQPGTSWSPDPPLRGGERVIAEYQNQFQALVAAHDPVALQLTLEGYFAPVAELQGQPSPNFILCPPEPQPTLEQRTFVMGERSNDPDGDNKPVTVTLTPFFLQATTVTRQQFALFDSRYETVAKGHLDEYASSPTAPAIMVSWFDAVLFATWLGGRLPTEAEWEYACRAETTTEYHCGSLLTEQDANFDEHHFDEHIGKTTPVGSYPPNLWGLYDMHGNVSEWCLDGYHEELLGGIDPYREDDVTDSVLRGGSWDDDARDCRSAYRFNISPGNQGILSGFRISRAM